MNKTYSINYIFYGLFFILLAFLQLDHFFLIQHASLSTRIFFLSYSLGQVLLETISLVFVSLTLKRFFHKSFYFLFISLVFILFLVHVIDYILVRLMDMTFWYAIGIVVEEKIENFIEMLYLTGIPIWVWITLVPVTIAIPFLGISLYKGTLKWTKKWELKPTLLQKVFLSFPLGLFVMDILVSPSLNPEDYETFEKTLPWKSTFIVPKHQMLSFEEKVEAKSQNFENPVISIKNKPPIFIFIAESLRVDYLDKKAAPHLFAFKNKNISFDQAFSNANSTDQSWFAIFNSRLPFYRSKVKEELHQEGSIPLKLLKQMGYKLHLYSAAQLKYYEMDSFIFGKDYSLLDSKVLYPHSWEKEAWQSDEDVIDHMLKDCNALKSEDGHAFIIFLDSTHFNYSWPKERESPFKPYLEEMTNFRVSNSIKNIEKIKNRYRNAIHFIDSLFGRFVHQLKKNGQYKKSVIIFTGDHGEEFLEHGHLFHASHLSPEQIKTPIFYKFGNKKPKFKQIMTSHMDIFPSIFDYLADNAYPELFDGASIFNKDKSSYIISTRYNGSRDPCEFLINDGKNVLVLKFNKSKNIFSSSKLEVISYQGKAPLSGSLPESFIPALEKTFQTSISID